MKKGPKTKINRENIKEILIKLNKANYIDELKENRLGKKIINDIEINGSIALSTLLNWLFFVENALKFIEKGIAYFETIILSEHIENNFLFKMKKENNDKSIGFFFGLCEQYKEECFVTEYSIQQTSLEQIFNMFAKNQVGTINTKKKKNKKNDEKSETDEKSEILVNNDLLKKIIS